MGEGYCPAAFIWGLTNALHLFIVAKLTTPKVSSLKYHFIALAGVTQWIERGPANQRVTGLIPSQGTCLGCRPDPQ